MAVTSTKGGAVQPSAETARRLRDAFAAGDLLDLRVGDRTSSGDHDPGTWSPARVVAADVITSLLLGKVDAEPGQVPQLFLAGAHIVGRLDLDGAEVVHRLHLIDCVLEQELLLNDARTRTIVLDGCRLPALNAEMARIDGNLVLARCVASKLALLGARVDGILALSGSRIEGVDGVAIQADGLTVSNDLFLREGFRAAGRVCMPGAVIGGDLALSDAELTGPDTSLNAGTAQVKGHLWLGPTLTVAGEVTLHYAAVEGRVHIEEARLGGFGATRARFGTDLFVAAHARCGGALTLTGASAVGRIDLELLELTDGAALLCQEIQAGVLELPRRMTGPLDLTNARIGVLKGVRPPWPDRVSIGGLTYDSIDPVHPASKQIDWLRRNPSGYQPQSYEQLAAMYRRIGHERDARAVLLAKQRDRRRTLPWVERAAGFVHDITAGYGYRSWLAALWLIAFLAAGTAYFLGSPPPPLKAGEHPDFNALAYCLDLIIPVIDLGQAKAWNPHGLDQLVSYVLTLVGWLLTVSVVAGVTRVLVRD
ncbi:hypothetical protein MTP10_40370 [Nonomuraea sp. 3-1Str]|uniref:hypothetical protein n=1 Tax=Nonomuraea sp. 3-1Str TaxID=2929801 RepID=UPI002855CC11|nr:hypothetical protein [Nonomuraea sp. 3-1Str]MDR8414973.1 hypothetical protein [Nonomuraea sp. 3-1Str]